MEHLRVFNYAELTALEKAGWADGQQATVSYYSTVNDGGGGTFWWNLGSSTTADGGTVLAPDEGGTGRWKRALEGDVSVKWFGARGDNSTDDYTAINNCVVAARAVKAKTVFPRPATAYKMGTTLALLDGDLLEGIGGAIEHWRSANECVKINYTGGTAAVSITAPASTGRSSIVLRHLHFDGTNASASTDGHVLTATASESYIEAILFDECAFTNFPRYQGSHVGASGSFGIFDITYRRCTMHNENRSADNIFHLDDAMSSQILFDDCYMVGYTSGKYVFRGISGQGVRFTNGTVAAYNGAHGIRAAAGLWLYGTSVESDDIATGTIGIQWAGSLGAVIMPSLCAGWETGVMIGSAGDSGAARGWIAGGNIGNNNVVDLIITNGGARYGVVMEIGYATGTAIITNNRLATDGADEVIFVRAQELAAVSLLTRAISVSGLPSANPAGRRQFVSDATATTFGTVVAGGGGAKVPVYSDGTNWRIG